MQIITPTIDPPSRGLAKRKRTVGPITENICTSLPPRKVVRIMPALPAPRLLEQDSNCSPEDKLKLILSSQGVHYQAYNFDSLPGFFQEITQEEIDSYGFDVLKAVREGDIEQLREFHNEGRPLKSSNRFGESLLHLACRKGLTEVVDFLIHEANVPLNVSDDMGRSPLHDAFWTCEPSFELMDLLLRACPDLLYINDKRGHTPLSYARRNHWGKWSEYFEQRSNLVVPTSTLVLTKPNQSN
jgi:hypothetical protein